MFFSIIVPCYNCENTIGRLLDSIVIQNEQDLEVILVDDTEDHNFLPIIDPYKTKLNIKVIGTDLHNHNPGNSRNYGIDAASGDWLLFIDSDDRLRENALSLFVESIINKKSPCHFAGIQVYSPQGPVEDNFQEYHIVWTHAKLYNRDYINQCRIRFLPTMKTCEDYYFNYQVMAHMYHDGYDYAWVQAKVYDWMWNDDSLSRSNEYVKDIRLHFYDHIAASLYPWVHKGLGAGDLTKVFARFKEFFVMSYFLYQYYLRKGINYDKGIVKDVLARVNDVFGITPLDLINSVESDYEWYMNSYRGAAGIVGENFVCPESFRTWVMNM